MKLLGNLCNIEKRTDNADCTVFTVNLDKNHFIYKAHFPGEPITPGACLFQICTELLEESLGRKVCIKTVKNVKFLQVIRPEETSTLDVSIATSALDNSGVRLKSSVSSGDTLFAHISLTFTIED